MTNVTALRLEIPYETEKMSSDCVTAEFTSNLAKPEYTAFEDSPFLNQDY